MHDIDPDIRLDRLVNECPSLTSALEQLGLDFCCGGIRRLSDACAERGLDVGEVTADLREIAVAVGVGADEAPWARMSVLQLVDHIEATHHRYLWDELPRLADLVDTVVDAHAAQHPDLLAVRDTLATLSCELVPHLQREETEVFPMLRRLATAEELPVSACGSIGGPISILLDDHEVVGELLATLRELTDHYRPPGDGCASCWTLYDALRSLEADIHLHVHTENNVLFPAVASIERRLAAAG